MFRAVVAALPVMVLLAGCGGDVVSSDEREIRNVLNETMDAWNRGDADGYAATICADQREHEREMSGNRKNDEALTVHKVTVDGDHAVAEITHRGDDGETEDASWELVRESGGWKLCN